VSQKYESPAAFKQALEHRLKAATPAGTPVARTRQLAVFDRFLARIAVAFRATHDRPTTLPEPPPEWRDAYAAIAADDSLPWPTLAEVFESARAFIEPVLSPSPSPPIWTPASARWGE